SFGSAADRGLMMDPPRSRRAMTPPPATVQFNLADMDSLRNRGWNTDNLVHQESLGMRYLRGAGYEAEPRGHCVPRRSLGTRKLASAFIVFADLWFANRGQQLLDNVFAFFPLGLGLEIRADAMSQHGDGHFLYVVN